MPKLKQPIKLHSMAYDVLLKYVVDCCVRFSDAGSLNEMGEVVAFVKKIVYTHIPMHILTSFAMKFCSDFFAQKQSGNERPSSHNKVVLEALLDSNINGLQGTEKILKHLDTENAHRFQKLYVINLYRCPKLPVPLESLCLEYLQTFNHPCQSTNAELMVIGRNCRQLKFVDVRYSKITEAGLRALDSCTELRGFEFSTNGLQFETLVHVLSVHKQLQKFFLSNDILFSDCNPSKYLDISYPSIRCLQIEISEGSPSDLKHILKKFPNLSDLILRGPVTGNFCALKNLSQLARLRICAVQYCSNISDITWNSFKQLLLIIGKNITTLYISGWQAEDDNLGQSDLNFLFDYCPNLEYLQFDCSYLENCLVIPSFPKLKQLILMLCNDTDEEYWIEFGVMPKLEFLSFRDYYSVSLNLQYFKSIVLNSVNLPELRELVLHDGIPIRTVSYLQKLVIRKNLQLKIVRKIFKGCWL